jgi:ribosomal protein S18 acetylase RimI-like enzyme
MLNPKIAFLRATDSDFDLARQAVSELNLATSRYRLPLNHLALRTFLADPRHYLLLAVEEDRVVGSLYGYALRHPYRNEPQFFLYGIDVRPECRNRGIGTGLVDYFIAEARQASAFEVWVLTDEANQPALAIYSRCGLRRLGTGEVMLELALVPQGSHAEEPGR